MNQQLVSVGDIARRIGQPLHRVAYITRKRKIKPLLSCGGRFFYAEGDVQRIKAELEELDERKAKLDRISKEAPG